LQDVIRVVIKSPCFDRESLADGVEEWLGRDTVDGRVTSIQVRASQGTLSFAIELGQLPPTLREFPELPRDCIEQRSAIALSIAMAITALETDLPAPAAAPDPRFVLSATGSLTTGIPTALGVGGGVGIEWRPTAALGFRFGVVGITSASEQRLRDTRPFQYRSHLASSVTEACLRWSAGGWELAGCAGVYIGGLWTASAGQFKGNSMTHTWYAASASAELRVAVSGGFGVLLGIDAIAPLRVITIAVADNGSLVAERRFPSLLGALRLGPTLAF